MIIKFKLMPIPNTFHGIYDSCTNKNVDGIPILPDADTGKSLCISTVNLKMISRVMHLLL